MMTVQPYDGTRLYDGYASEGTRMIQSAPQQPKNTTKGSLAGLKPNCRQKRCTGFLPTYRYIQDMCFQCREKGCTKESLLAGRTLVAQEMQFEAEARAAKKASYPGGCYPMVLQVRELLRGINQKGNSNEANRDRDPKIASGPRLGSNPKVKYRLLDSGSSQLHQNTRRNSDRTKPIALDKASLVDKAPGRVNRFVLDEWIEQITIESQERDESQEPKLKRVLDLRSREVLEPSTQKTLSRKQGKRFANVIAQTPTTTLTSFRNYEEYSDASRPSLRQQFVQRDPDRPIKPVQIIGDQGGGEEWADVSLTKSKSS
ncbi:hypothetical protein DFH27DRAFT_544132 [Peziza echinospora]|nr:hypothetical protein DFH27DRAFT_544132 [Peziza echinospora]